MKNNSTFVVGFPKKFLTWFSQMKQLMFNPHPNDLGLLVLDRGFSVTHHINKVAKWVDSIHSYIFKPILLVFAIGAGIVVYPITYIGMVVVVKQILAMVSKLEQKIPHMSLDELIEIQSTFGKVSSRYNTEDVMSKINSESALTAPFKVHFMRMLNSIEQLIANAKAQQELDLDSLKIDWDDNVPVGFIPHQIQDNADW